MTNEIQPICLPGKYKEKYDEKCQVSGWGQTNVTVGLKCSFHYTFEIKYIVRVITKIKILATFRFKSFISIF